MKTTLLILLFISGLVAAQVDTTIKTIKSPIEWRISSVVSQKVGMETTLYGKHYDIILEYLVSLWKNYQKECTAEYRFEKLKRMKVWIPPYTPYWKKWLRKEPTFKGFMLYLERKLK